MMDYSLCASVWLSVKHRVLRPAHLAAPSLWVVVTIPNCFLSSWKNKRCPTRHLLYLGIARNLCVSSRAFVVRLMNMPVVQWCQRVSTQKESPPEWFTLAPLSHHCLSFSAFISHILHSAPLPTPTPALFPCESPPRSLHTLNRTE